MYALIGLGLALMIDGVNNRQRLIFIVWPIPVALAVFFIICVLINSTFELIKDYIKDYKR